MCSLRRSLNAEHWGGVHKNRYLFAANPRQSSFQPKLPFIEYSAAGVKIMFIIDCILGISPCVKGAG